MWSRSWQRRSRGGNVEGSAARDRRGSSVLFCGDGQCANRDSIGTVSAALVRNTLI
jgi:hypothetical protein